MTEAKCIRVARIQCPSVGKFRNMHRLCSQNARIAGARSGELGEFFVIDEYRFSLLKQAHEAEEMT